MKKANEITNKLDPKLGEKIVEKTKELEVKEFEAIETNIDSTNKVIEKEIDFDKADEFYQSNAKLGEAYKNLAISPNSTEKDKDNLMKIVNANIENHEKDREEVKNLKVYEEAEKNRKHLKDGRNTFLTVIGAVIVTTTVGVLSYLFGKKVSGNNEVITKATNKLLKK